MSDYQSPHDQRIEHFERMVEQSQIEQRQREQYELEEYRRQLEEEAQLEDAMDTFDQWQHREYQQQKDYFERLRDEMESQVDQEWEEYHAEELEHSQAIASYFMQFDDDGNEDLPLPDEIIELPFWSLIVWRKYKRIPF